jgi:hypothetical protein
MFRHSMLGIVAVVIALVAFAPSTLAAGPARFGARLTTDTFPSNAFQGKWCDDQTHASCTWVERVAYSRPTGYKAPKDGTIRKIRLIAGVPGGFRLQLARVRPGNDPGSYEMKIVRQGKYINYEGQDPSWDDPDPLKIESFVVNLTVKKGDYLAIKASKASFLRCDSGGSRILQSEPPLQVGGSYQDADDTDGCFMLLEAVYA